MNTNLQNYFNDGFNKVEGWVEDELFTVVDSLNNLNINKQGGVCEIGIHHGKLYILLNQIVDSNYQSYAIDIFDDQELNVDKSGEGSLEIFQQNLQKYDAHSGRNTVIIKGDSTDSGLGLPNIIKSGTMRFISVDGGHTPTHVINDLKLANDLVNNQGIVIVDDVMNHWWPGVIEGVMHFLQLKTPLVPVMMGHNKLYMCKMGYHNFYLHHFANLDLNGPRGVRKFFGHDIVINRYWPKYMNH